MFFKHVIKPVVQLSLLFNFNYMLLSDYQNV